MGEGVCGTQFALTLSRVTCVALGTSHLGSFDNFLYGFKSFHLVSFIELTFPAKRGPIVIMDTNFNMVKLSIERKKSNDPLEKLPFLENFIYSKISF